MRICILATLLFCLNVGIFGQLNIPCNNWLRLPSYPSSVQVGDLDVPGDQITVEAIFVRTVPYSNGYNWAGDLVSKHRGPIDANYLLRPNNAEITTSNGYFITPPVCEIQLNKVYHAAFTYDGATLKFYRNGFLMSSVPATGNLFQNNFKTSIGLYDDLVHQTNLLGYINEARIWNTVRTQAQIRAFMNTSLPSPASQTGLLAYYTFDNLLNKQGNPAWNGTLTGSATINTTNPVCNFVADSCALLPCTNLNFDFGYVQDVCNPFSVQFTGIGTDNQNPHWSFGDATFIAGTNNPIHVYPSTGTYIVKYSVSSGMCTDTITKTIDLSVIKANVVLTQDTLLCFGATKQLLTAPSLGFCWSPVTYLNNPMLPNPITSTPQDITYYLLAEIQGNNVIVNGNFTSGNSGFTSQYNYANPNTTEGEYFVGSNPQAWNASLSNCTDHTGGNGNMLLVNGSPVSNMKVWNQTVTVTPNTNYAFSTWIQALWPPNPAQLQFSINNKDIGNFITTSLPTCTWSRFYTTWNSGSNTTASISIVNKNTLVNGNDFALDDISFAPLQIKRDSVKITVEKPVVTATNNTSICEGTQLQLNAAGANTYIWSPVTGLNNPNIANPLATPPGIGPLRYIVKGTTINNCTANDTVDLFIDPKPVITKSADATICLNASTQLSASGGVIYSWLPSGTLDNPNSPTPIATPLNTTKYFVTVTGVNTCKNVDSISVSVRSSTSFSISPGTDICNNTSTQLNASGGDLYSWSPAGSLDNPSVPNPLATPGTTTPYSVLITDLLCSNSITLSTTITVRPLPVIRASKSNDVDCSTPISQLNATGGTVYSWLPSNNTLNNPNIANPVATPLITTKYIVKGIDQLGCINYDSVIVDVKNAIGNGLYLMATGFTPDNNGRNDCFGIKYWGNILELEFSIYNRWGERIFFTRNPSDCWDGKVHGVPQDPAVFVYMIKAKTTCQPYVFRKGTFALIR